MNSFESQDRGMKKWGGFLLSEHTEHLEEEKKAPQWEIPMDQEMIFQILRSIIENRSVAAIQLFKADATEPDPFIEGRIVATEGDWIHVRAIEGIRVIDLESIRYIEERGYRKWYK
ncbi:hypothetical protein HCA73_16415 [Listeria booriae]|uniref:Uncharacterized protein n=1 Tax=Listeria booriae TaxID=1552123 RepID=A0A842FYZ3_9LIST|nr:hypothetical protein [Listeria booriae]MBC1914238.1 hypothetical protein [Listeria booriae]MBC2293029.1 hypothetical protein [Listeria booriae]